MFIPGFYKYYGYFGKQHILSVINQCYLVQLLLKSKDWL